MDRTPIEVISEWGKSAVKSKLAAAQLRAGGECRRRIGGGWYPGRVRDDPD